jgi:hypothetical protein
MHGDKFVDLPQAKQLKEVHARFRYHAGQGWFTPEGLFCGPTEDDVICALIDLEEAEINAIGDCMTGSCMLSPSLADFVRKS